MEYDWKVVLILEEWRIEFLVKGGKDDNTCAGTIERERIPKDTCIEK